MEQLLGGEAGRFPALRDRASYGHAVHTAASWRQLYVREFGVPIERTADAAPLWTEFHREDTTVPPLFKGVAEVVRALAGRPQGIVSQNSRANIEHSLEPAELLGLFGHIVADEDLPFHRQKPEPDGLLQCAAALLENDRSDCDHIILYVGDHPVDIECVRRAVGRADGRAASWRIASVGVEYGGHKREWPSEPDYRISSADQLLEIVDELEAP